MTNSNAVENHRNNVGVATKQTKKINREEKGKSSSISSFVCEICIVTKTEAESFTISGCTHSYCTDCVVKYVCSKLDDNVINIRCPVPRCRGLLETNGCREILPKSVLHRWEKSLREAAVLESESKRFLYDRRSNDGPHPRQMCVTCTDEDRMMMKLAERNGWKRCPKCRFYVEKKPFTCSRILCRCGHVFCYGCGGSPCGGSPCVGSTCGGSAFFPPSWFIGLSILFGFIILFIRLTEGKNSDALDFI
ncbi:probable E3 ubiquitin-protein ligase ARI3 [Arachis ipaensis]|nr:probable E3 ubiquitin-protein ligase ARI3 [Arachis ipaensis]XP_025684587.1 probable E3 ubiquitin-protein ligase ARI3 [Arachis hypogaea]QHN80428.1 putative E3 ubiquitin-protein ligase [Arachis hypogaea]